MKILGTKFYQHDSAVCLLDFDQNEVFAMSTERVTRIKHDYFDISPILDAYPEIFKDVSHLCYAFSNSDKRNDPYADLGKSNILEAKYYQAYRELIKPRYLSDLTDSRTRKMRRIISLLPVKPFKVLKVIFRYLATKIISDNSPSDNLEAVVRFTEDILKSRGINVSKISFFDHHLCHAAASYYFSPFNVDSEVLCLTLDGSGDGYFSKAFLVKDDKFKLIGKSPNVIIPGSSGREMTSLGEIYAKFTAAMDLYPGSDEGKVEARAAYGLKDEKLYKYLMDMTIVNDRCIAFDLNAIHFIYDDAYLQTERARMKDEDFCASVQEWLNDTVVSYLNILSGQLPGVTNLALSGGIAANIIMSLNIYERTPFRNIFVLPFMGDEGVGAGAAILKAKKLGKDVLWLKDLTMPYFGDSYSRDQVKTALDNSNENLIIEDLGDNWQQRAAQDLHQKKIISLFNDKMEFGPRALGNRSIVANPTDDKVTDRINASIKRRPWYQPFCPSILEEERERLFHDSFSHKHMAIAFRLKEEFRGDLPGATHVDGTARPQFVSIADNQKYWKLLKEFKALSGYGILINTSFNLHGRAVVRTPQDAIRDYNDCGIDVLYIEGFRISR